LSYPLVMSIESIISLISAEIEQLKQARALLAASGQTASTLVSASPKTAPTGKKRGPKPGKKSTTKAVKKRRTMSPEARQRIAEAQHRRWAALKAKPKSK